PAPLDAFAGIFDLILEARDLLAQVTLVHVSDQPPLIPALPPHLFADGTGNPRCPRLGRDDARLWRATGDFQHKFCAGRILELRPLADRHDERAWAADHAVLVVDVEVLDIERHLNRALEHDRQ